MKQYQNGELFILKNIHFVKHLTQSKETIDYTKKHINQWKKLFSHQAKKLLLASKTHNANKIFQMIIKTL